VESGAHISQSFALTTYDFCYLKSSNSGSLHAAKLSLESASIISIVKYLSFK